MEGTSILEQEVARGETGVSKENFLGSMTDLERLALIEPLLRVYLLQMVEDLISELNRNKWRHFNYDAINTGESRQKHRLDLFSFIRTQVRSKLKNDWQFVLEMIGHVVSDHNRYELIVPALENLLVKYIYATFKWRNVLTLPKEEQARKGMWMGNIVISELLSILLKQEAGQFRPVNVLLAEEKLSRLSRWTTNADAIPQEAHAIHDHGVIFWTERMVELSRHIVDLWAARSDRVGKVLLEGPPGTGKTQILRFLLDVLGFSHTVFPVGGVMTRTDLIGEPVVTVAHQGLSRSHSQIEGLIEGVLSLIQTAVKVDELSKVVDFILQMLFIFDDSIQQNINKEVTSIQDELKGNSNIDSTNIERIKNQLRLVLYQLKLKAMLIGLSGVESNREYNNPTSSKWVDAGVVQALRSGDMVILDELEKALGTEGGIAPISELLSHSTGSSIRLSGPGELFIPRDFGVFATVNSTDPLPPYILDRFASVEVDYPSSGEWVWLVYLWLSDRDGYVRLSPNIFLGVLRFFYYIVPELNAAYHDGLIQEPFSLRKGKELCERIKAVSGSQSLGAVKRIIMDFLTSKGGGADIINPETITREIWQSSLEERGITNHTNLTKIPIINQRIAGNILGRFLVDGLTGRVFRSVVVTIPEAELNPDLAEKIKLPSFNSNGDVVRLAPYSSCRVVRSARGFQIKFFEHGGQWHETPIFMMNGVSDSGDSRLTVEGFLEGGRVMLIRLTNASQTNGRVSKQKRGGEQNEKWALLRPFALDSNRSMTMIEGIDGKIQQINLLSERMIVVVSDGGVDFYALNSDQASNFEYHNNSRERKWSKIYSYKGGLMASVDAGGKFVLVKTENQGLSTYHVLKVDDNDMGVFEIVRIDGSETHLRWSNYSGILVASEANGETTFKVVV